MHNAWFQNDGRIVPSILFDILVIVDYEIVYYNKDKQHFNLK